MRERLPHTGVYARISRSKIHGVGVIAIRNIPKGTRVFVAGDNEPTVCVKKQQLEQMPREIRRLYEDFPIIQKWGEVYRCPSSFNQLTPGWFLNAPKTGETANVGVTSQYTFYALRNIEIGEELTVNYSKLRS